MCLLLKRTSRNDICGLKITTPNGMSTFVTGCYIPHCESIFYADMDRDDPFSDLVEDIVHYKSKGEVIIMGDMNACTRSLQLDTQETIMPCLLRRPLDSLMYDRVSMDTKEPDFFGNALLHMCNSTGMVIGNGMTLWKDTSGFTCRKHNGDSVIDYVLVSESGMHIVKDFMLGNWNP